MINQHFFGSVPITPSQIIRQFQLDISTNPADFHIAADLAQDVGLEVFSTLLRTHTNDLMARESHDNSNDVDATGAGYYLINYHVLGDGYGRPFRDRLGMMEGDGLGVGDGYGSSAQDGGGPNQRLQTAYGHSHENGAGRSDSNSDGSGFSLPAPDGSCGFPKGRRRRVWPP